MNNDYAEDRKIVEHIVNRDERAFLLFYKTHYKSLHHFVSKQIYDQAVAEELTHDIFMGFLESLRDFRFQSSLKTFLFSIARNKVIDTIRKKKIKKLLFSALPSYFVEGLVKVFIDDELEKKELIDKMKKTFESLPHDYEVVLRLKYIEEKPVKDISEDLALSFKATESLLFRARKAFVKAFNSSH